MDRLTQLKTVQEEAAKLFERKNKDYGDAFANYGIIGILVRMGDKISRLQSITTKQVSLINTESLRDTLIDLHNYSAMAIMLLDEDKKKSEDKSVLLNSNYFELLKNEHTEASALNNNSRFESNIFNFRG